ncbi:MAG: hypothetical protein C0603_10240 [Denitrovibrio sp.]|nr:MAG: hypothetical protein C0603_10240 [Denitrovibrio sp.]
MGGRDRKKLYELLKSFYEGVLKEDYFEGSPEQRLYRKIYFETFRHLGFIEKCLDTLYKETPGPELRAALALGACQILFIDDVPAYAAVNETVSLVKQHKRNFVNAILRSVGRQKEEFLKNYNIREDFPAWFIKRWEARLGDELEEFLQDLNSKPPFYGVDKETFELKLLNERSEDYVMDRGSYAIAKLAGNCHPMSVLDCCAAPGGKTYILSGTYPEARVFAVEKSARRFKSLQRNMEELGVKNVDLIQKDLMWLETEAKFDLVLLDAPCTALGTIKRHPEVRWLRHLNDVRENSKRQLEMLKKAATFMAPGGRLIYSVCSMEPEETTEVIEKFLASENGYKLVEPSCDDDFKNGKYLISIPYIHQADGFFGAVLTKK